MNSVQRVEAGQTLRVCLPEREESRVAAVPGPVEICFEDAWLAVLEKPADLPVHPGRGHYGDTLSNYVIWHYRQQGISLVPRFVSRLDKGTSGLLILAKGAECRTGCKSCFTRRHISAAIWLSVRGRCLRRRV